MVRCMLQIILYMMQTKMSNLEQAVTNLDQSRKLYELGFRKESVFWWFCEKQIGHWKKMEDLWEAEGEWWVYRRRIDIPNYPAYLLSEIMEMLPQYLPRAELRQVFSFEASGWRRAAYYRDLHEDANVADSLTIWDTPLSACYYLLIWCIENWFISTNK